MASRMRNIGNLFGDVKTRNIIIVTVLILIGAVAFGIFGFQSGTPSVAQPAASAASVPKSVQSVAGLTQVTPEQQKLQTSLNDQRYQQAQSSGKSAFPSPIGLLDGDQDSTTQTTSSPDQDQTQSTTQSAVVGTYTASTAPQSNSSSVTNAAQQTAQLQQQTQQQVQQETQQQQAQEEIGQNMTNQAQALLSSWSGVTAQQYVTAQQSGASATATSGDTTQSANQSESQSSQEGDSDSTQSESSGSDEPAVIKAGDVMFGVLITAVNSDEASTPILAKIISGKYKGSKLVGSMQRPTQITGVKQETVILAFNTLNIPHSTESVSITAVAIDPTTARTALASSVDKHLLERYGTLFASSFMEGYGNAITQAGSITFSPVSGGQETIQQELNPQEEFFAALGTVGERWGQEMSDVFNRPYTITVDSGIGIGILFLDDVDDVTMDADFSGGDQ